MLTDDEIALVNDLGECCNKFYNLEKAHPSDKDNFVFHIHALQNIVMCRSAQRLYPKEFPNTLTS